MSSPVTPEEICNAVPKATDTKCRVFSKVFLELPLLICRLGAWMIPLLERLEQGEVGGGGTTGLPAPTNVSATKTRTTDITVTWGGVTSATSYDIYRGLNTDTSGMALIGTTDSGTTFVDTGAPLNTVLWYAIKAKNATQTSAFSGVADGFRPETEEPDEPTIINYGTPQVKPITIPTGKSSMEVLLWGGGGKGGGKLDGWGIPGSGTPPGGGGGASGSFVRVTAISVEPGETYYLHPGDASEPTAIFREDDGGDEYVTATPGGDGKKATVGTVGLPGAAASFYGSTTMGGTLDTDESTIGNPGSGATGGSGISYGGVTAGLGANGTTGFGPVDGDGQHGFIRVILT